MSSDIDLPLVSDADLELAEGAAIGDVIHARRRAGICCHQSAVGSIREPVYPEQHQISGDQLACTEHINGCRAVFAAADDWFAAMDAATADGQPWGGPTLTYGEPRAATPSPAGTRSSSPCA